MIPPPDASEKKGPGDKDSQDKEQNSHCTTLPGSLIPGEPRFVTLSSFPMSPRQLTIREALRETLARTVVYSLGPEEQADLGREK